MKKVVAFFVFFLALTARTQEIETLVGRDVESGGFGAPVIKYTQIKKKPAMQIGGRGGWIIDHQFVFGGGGYGIASEKMKLDHIGDEVIVGMGYGGLILEYIAFPYRLFHFSVASLFGAGGVSYSEVEGDEDVEFEGDAIMVIEPELNVMLNISERVRLGLSSGYRFVFNTDLQGFENKDLSCFNAGFLVKIGKF